MRHTHGRRSANLFVRNACTRRRVGAPGRRACLPTVAPMLRRPFLANGCGSRKRTITFGSPRTRVPRVLHVRGSCAGGDASPPRNPVRPDFEKGNQGRRRLQASFFLTRDSAAESSLISLIRRAISERRDIVSHGA